MNPVENEVLPFFLRPTVFQRATDVLVDKGCGAIYEAVWL